MVPHLLLLAADLNAHALVADCLDIMTADLPRFGAHPAMISPLISRATVRKLFNDCSMPVLEKLADVYEPAKFRAFLKDILEATDAQDPLEAPLAKAIEVHLVCFGTWGSKID